MGYVVGAAAAVALVLRLRRGRSGFAVDLSGDVSDWISIVLATHYSAEPNQNRYVYDRVVFVLLVARRRERTTISRTAVVVLSRRPRPAGHEHRLMQAGVATAF